MPDCLIVFSESDGKSVLSVIVVLCGLELLTNSSIPYASIESGSCLWLELAGLAARLHLHKLSWIVKALTCCSYGSLIPLDDF